jgi:uncharacterized protein (TIGR00251 family)
MTSTFLVRVTPKASRSKVIREGDSLKVYVTRPAQDGQANKEVIKLLADFLNCRKYQLKIVKGENSRVKIISLSDV